MGNRTESRSMHRFQGLEFSEGELHCKVIKDTAIEQGECSLMVSQGTVPPLT